jgi:spore coat polysaccharide biosynthesis protein SpsF
MRTIAIIQARMGSSRLPGKVLKKLGRATVLSNVVERVRRSRRINDVAVATTREPADAEIVQECSNAGITIFRGSTEDVLDRYYEAALQLKAEVVVRITADCPLIDPDLIDLTVQAFLADRPDYASNVLTRTYPRGLDTEVFSVETLQRAWQEAAAPYERAHVTPYIYNHPRRFRLLSVSGSDDFSSHRWTLDTPEDLDFLQQVYARFPEANDFSWRAVLALLVREPALSLINSHVQQKQLQEG